MKAILLFVATVAGSLHPARAAQVDSTTPRSTTERPNVSAPGLQKTFTGVLMDATCSAITDGRSDLTQTPRLVPRTATERSSTERSRPASAPNNAVPDKFRDCRLKASTTSYALYTNGKVYMLDRVSNQMMQERMAKAPRNNSAANSNDWTTSTLVGTSTSDDVLTLRSIQK